MFFGALELGDVSNGNGNSLRDLIKPDWAASRHGRAYFWSDRRLALWGVPSDSLSLGAASEPCVAGNDGSIVLVFEGRIYNASELRESLEAGSTSSPGRIEEILIRLYEKYGDSFPSRLNGKFAFALWDPGLGKLLLGRDHLGFEVIYYTERNGRVFFGTSLRGMVEAGMLQTQLNTDALVQYLLYCYNPDNETFIRGVHKLQAGHVLCRQITGRSLKSYWHLSFADQEMRSDAQYRRELLSLIEDSVRIRLGPEGLPGVLLSGGTDSSTIVSLTSKLTHRPFPTFHFRCRGKTFDESGFARFVAERFGAEHNEVLYTPDRLSLISEAVKYMDEPFCDQGIEIATFMLGREARGKAMYILSGEGGDELFGGHPTYLADRVAAVIDYLPEPIMKPMAAILSRIPDSNQKKDLPVKLKRFAYGLTFPRQLLTHRWRICYTPEELRRLCTKDILNGCRPEQLYAPMLRHYIGADGRDILSRSIYSEYSTLVDFYLRRLGLLKAHSIEAHLPLLDVRLVEYAARVPSSMKIRGISETKYIYRKVLEGIVPREVLYDRPKLGHSVPMKNWLRSDAGVLKMVRDVLTDDSFKRRGFFKAEYIDRLIREHMDRTNNHSHRLWGLTVLEIWLQNHLSH